MVVRRVTKGLCLALVFAVPVAPLSAKPILVSPKPFLVSAKPILVSAKPMPDYAVRQAAANRATCVPAVAKLKQAGVIRRQPAPNRFDIDETLWKTLSSLDQNIIFSMMACSVFGGRSKAYLDDREFVVLHGFQSGKRLMRGSKAGLVVD